MKRIYLDNNATTPIDRRVVEAMWELYNDTECHGGGIFNPSSPHYFGRKAKAILTSARDFISRVLYIQPDEIVFTSCGTEALNFLIRGFYGCRGKHVITSNAEHTAVYHTVQKLPQAKVTYLPVGSWGAVRLEQIEAAVTDQTGLVVLSAVNSLTGVKTDLDAIALWCEKRQIPFVVDGVQLLGKEIFIIPKGVTGMAFSAHKFHGPVGIGFAFLRSSSRIPSLIVGGGQEKGMRSGTENLIGIVGMAKALEVVLKDLPESIERMGYLKEKLVTGLQRQLGNLILHGEGDKVCNTAHIGFPGAIDGEALLVQLDLLGIAVGLGSACSSSNVHPSPILLNMGISRELASGSLRFSLSRYNTLEEIETAISLISQAVQQQYKS